VVPAVLRRLLADKSLAVYLSALKVCVGVYLSVCAPVGAQGVSSCAGVLVRVYPCSRCAWRCTCQRSRCVCVCGRVARFRLRERARVNRTNQ
jgi:hypothetical protein